MKRKKEEPFRLAASVAIVAVMVASGVAAWWLTTLALLALGVALFDHKEAFLDPGAGFGWAATVGWCLWVAVPALASLLPLLIVRRLRRTR